jgi:NAD(P)-dependent dehydrogenase (short-subunit alcohol dehydrogenase family)
MLDHCSTSMASWLSSQEAEPVLRGLLPSNRSLTHSTGIGLVITKALVANDAHEIYIIGRRLEVLQEAARITEPNVVFPLPGDVTPLETLLPMTEHVRARSGYVNLVIANAWIMGPQPLSPQQLSLLLFQSTEPMRYRRPWSISSTHMR